MLIVISAPSGTGKSTLCNKLRKLLPGIKIAVSYTTRPPRRGEKNSKDYFFVTQDEFVKKLNKNEFLEWATVYGYNYATPREFVEENLAQGKDVVLEIDVQGAMKIREIYPDGLLIFVAPPSFIILKKRLRARQKDSPEQIKKRLEQARKEISCIKKYDYLVINDKLEKAIKDLVTIISAEKLKISRLKKEKKEKKLLKNIKL